MKNKIILNSLLSVVIGLVLLVPGVFAAAFGIAPPWIINENLKQGSNFVYQIDLNTNDPVQDMTVKTKLTGDEEVMKWLTVRNADVLMMPAGKQHVPMYVDIHIPDDAKIGKYKGDIGITVMPKNTAGNGDVSIFLGGHIAVQLEVINYDVNDFWVKSINVEPMTVGQPVSLKIFVKNLGNVTLDAIKTKVEVTDKKGNVVANGTGDKLTKLVYPHTVEEAKITVQMPNLDVGNYWANVNAYKDGKSIYQNRLYLTVDDTDVNNVLKTSVQVGEKGSMKSAAGTVPATVVTTTPVVTTPPVRNHALDNNRVQVQTTVTVKAPFTNKLIGIVIILLGILIIIATKIQKGMLSSLKRKKRKN